jgi:uncharacterized membrane protein
MNKADFLKELSSQLRQLATPDVEEILRDQEEYIRDAIQSGRREDEVISSLGDPKVFAASLAAESRIHSAEKSTSLKQQAHLTLGAVIAILALAPLNLIFVLGPFCGLVGVLIGLWAASAGILVAALACLVVFFVKLLFLSVGVWAQLSTFFFIAGCIGGSVLGMMLMVEITQWVLLGTLAYLKWNLNFIKART